MPEKTQKELIHELIHKVDDSNVKLDTLTTSHYKLDGSVQEIITELKGTKFDPDKGLVPQVKRNKACIDKMKRQQAKREGVIATATIVFATFVSAFFSWLLFWKDNPS